ncbi:MAG TPA: ATP-binding protein [Chloroflexi bacterium]|nr:ATP-binding protein [Chloroflexota bacterium]
MGQKSTETKVAIGSDTDVIVACQKGRLLASRVGLSINEQAAVAIAVLEVARNIVKYAGRGQVVLSPVCRDGRDGILVVARDEGPGIPDIEQALQDGYSTGGGLGLGLSGAKRLMDEFEIMSCEGEGTTVTMRKWAR